MDAETGCLEPLLTLDAAVTRWAGLFPDRVALNAPGNRLTYAELLAARGRVAAELRDMGVVRGDAVAFQLPNWIEALVLYHALTAIGAVVVPILPALREHDLAYMLAESRARLFVTCSAWHGFDYQALARTCCDTATEIALVEAGGVASDGPMLQRAGHGERAPVAPTAPHPASLGQGDGLDAVCSMIFTSGTSGRPKGVLYTHRGLAAEGREMAGVEGLDGEARLFVPPSIAHVSGICFGLYMPLAVGCGVFLLPDWSGDAALDTIWRERCNWTAGATPFLQAVVAAAEKRPETLRGLRVFRCGGASVPPGLIRRARALGLDAYRSYGMSEHPTISGRTGQPDEVCMFADGVVHPGVSLRVLDLLDPTRVLPAGEPGEIAVRGPDHSLGYLRAADNASSMLDGWFLTGDIGRVSKDNVVTITGRKKDIIIRKGENIAAREIEDMVGENPAVIGVAVVGMPDAERGEMVCCVVVPRNGAVLGVADICTPLRRAGLASFKLPERVVCVDALPCNANGKVLKTEIKLMLAGEDSRLAALSDPVGSTV